MNFERFFGILRRMFLRYRLFINHFWSMEQRYFDYRGASTRRLSFTDWWIVTKRAGRNRNGQVQPSSNRSEHVNNVNYSPAKRKPKWLHFNPAFRCTRLLPEIIKFWRIVEFLGKEKYCILDWKQSGTDPEFEVHLNIKDKEKGQLNTPKWRTTVLK